jgi:hypothetical protein
MSVRFAPAHNAARLIGWHARGRGLVWPAQMRAANDGADSARPTAAFDPLLTDALRHFAVHGLGAVNAALTEAELARAEGDANAKDRWLAITQMFDRRRAAAANAATTPA